MRVRRISISWCRENVHVIKSPFYTSLFRSKLNEIDELMESDTRKLLTIVESDSVHRITTNRSAYRTVRGTRLTLPPIYYTRQSNSVIPRNEELVHKYI